MAVAIWAGLWPGLVATAAATLLTDYFIFEPRGSFAIANPTEAISLALFAFMGVFISLDGRTLPPGQQKLAPAERELAARQSEEQFRALANAIPQLCWMANADGWIYWYNQRWYDYTGTTPQQMEGWGWQSVHDPKTLPECSGEVEGIHRDGGTVRHGVPAARCRRRLSPISDARDAR